MSNSAALGLPYLAPAQAQKHVTHNEALRLLDLIVQLSVLDRDRSAPPSSPEEGQRHIVGPTPTGDWAGQDGAVAVREAGAWSFLAPREGWRAYVGAEGAVTVWDGATWVLLAPDFDNLAGVGINAASDATNRLSVSAPATLLSHEGAGHQLKLNKAGASDTASLLFQTSWSGRAEMGTAGSDAFAIKVSADGAAWQEAMAFDPVSGRVTGTAVQASATDVTPGVLMRADWGYGPGNLLGLVSESGGQPTGAVLEAGADYLRLACGTQIVWTTLMLTRIDGATLGVSWSFAKPFVGAAHASGSYDLDAAQSLTPGADALGALAFSAGDGDGLTVELRRQAGQADFAVGDSCPARLLALGRWA